MHSKHLIVYSIKHDINFHMPAVDNDFLLLFYNLKVDHLKGLVGAEHPAQKMFVCVWHICGEFLKLQEKECTRQQREDSTAIILRNLQAIVDYINNGEIPEKAGDETILWFEYDSKFYLMHELSIH